MMISNKTIIYLFLILNCIVINLKAEEPLTERRKIERHLDKYTIKSVDGIREVSIDRMFDDLPDLVKKQRIKQMADQGAIIVDISKYWHLIDDINTALVAASNEEEPYRSEILEIYRNQFNEIESNDEKKYVAAILYRYNIDLGFNYLFKVLDQNNDKDSALIFTLNKELSAYPPIVKLISEETNVSNIIYLLGTWGEITTDLISEKLINKYDKNKNSYIRALSLSNHNVNNDVIDLIENLFLRSTFETKKIELAGTLYNLNPKDINISKFLDDKIDNYDSLTNVEKIFLINTFKRIKYENSKKIAIKILEDYINHNQNKMPDKIEVEAAIILSRLNISKGNDVLYRFFKTLIDYKITPKDRYYPVLRIMLSENPNSKTELVKIIGEEEVNRIQRINNLKVLPKKYLPDYTKKYYSFDLYSR